MFSLSTHTKNLNEEVSCTESSPSLRVLRTNTLAYSTGCLMLTKGQNRRFLWHWHQFVSLPGRDRPDGEREEHRQPRSPHCVDSNPVGHEMNTQLVKFFVKFRQFFNEIGRRIFFSLTPSCLLSQGFEKKRFFRWKERIQVGTALAGEMGRPLKQARGRRLVLPPTEGNEKKVNCMISLSLSLSHTHTLSLFHTHKLSLSHTHIHTLSLTHTHAHTLSLSHTHTHTQTLLHASLICTSLLPPLSLSLSLSLSHTHTHTHARTNTLSLPHPHTHSLSFTLTLPFSPPHSFTCKPYLYLSFTHSLSHTHTLSLSLFPPQTHTHTHSLSHTYTNSHSLFLSHTPFHPLPTLLPSSLICISLFPSLSLTPSPTHKMYQCVCAFFLSHPHTPSYSLFYLF